MRWLVESYAFDDTQPVLVNSAKYFVMMWQLLGHNTAMAPRIGGIFLFVAISSSSCYCGISQIICRRRICSPSQISDPSSILSTFSTSNPSAPCIFGAQPQMCAVMLSAESCGHQIFGLQDSQQHVAAAVERLAVAAAAGKNATLLAMGRPDSGKSYMLGGNTAGFNGSRAETGTLCATLISHT